MNKILLSFLVFLSLSLVIFNACCCSSSSSGASPSIYNRGLTIEQAKVSNKPIVIDFYTDWCGACKYTAPIFDQVRTELSSDAEFVMVNVDNNRALADEYGVRSYPTFYLLNPSTMAKDKIPYNMTRDKESFVNYLNQTLDNYKPTPKTVLY